MSTNIPRVVDGLLRGHYTQREELAQGRIEVPVRTLIRAGFALGALYGVFMGLFGALRGGRDGGMQLLASTLKVPLLFLLTLVVTFPSLYVFSALRNSRLAAGQTLRLLLVAIGVNLAVLASFGPVTAFFTLSTDSYPFMVVLNFAFFAVAGIVATVFLGRALRAVFPPSQRRAPVEALAPAGEAPAFESAPTPSLPRRQPELSVLRIWIVIYAVVGAQMGWILRPFIGTPDAPFEWFRERRSNVLEAILHAIGALFS